ncbi:hypothetical protein [Massilia eburnea]|uniref:hypothetical protein n=1 Tax=Massilia eburnea TaxID=1776165 RepID=UPI003D6AE87D
MPGHIHRLNASTAVATTSDPNGSLLAPQGPAARADAFNGLPNVGLVSNQVSSTGGSQPHENTLTLPGR